MLNNVLLLSFILPCDAPRIKVRYIEALNHQFLFELICFRNNRNVRKKFRLLSFLMDCKRASKKDYDMVIAFDPAAMFIASIMQKTSFSTSSEVKFVYDRSENWPLNWRGRKNILLRFIGKFLVPAFNKFEAFFLKKFNGLVAVNFSVKNAIKFQGLTLIYPNRSSLGERKRNLEKNDTAKEFDFVYSGSINEFRCIDKILYLSSILNAQYYGKKKPILLIGNASEYSKKLIMKHQHENLVQLIQWQDQVSLLSYLTKAKYGIVGLDKIGQFNNSISGKFSDYFSLDMPVLCLGNALSLQKVAKLNSGRVFELSNFEIAEVKNTMDKLKSTKLKSQHWSSFKNKAALLSTFMEKIISNDVHRP